MTSMVTKLNRTPSRDLHNFQLPQGAREVANLPRSWSIVDVFHLHRATHPRQLSGSDVELRAIATHNLPQRALLYPEPILYISNSQIQIETPI